jgi:hypothetical protein
MKMVGSAVTMGFGNTPELANLFLMVCFNFERTGTGGSPI